MSVTPFKDLEVRDIPEALALCGVSCSLQIQSGE